MKAMVILVEGLDLDSRVMGIRFRISMIDGIKRLMIISMTISMRDGRGCGGAFGWKKITRREMSL